MCDDKKLFEQLQSGDRRALALVYDSHAPALYSYLVRRVGDAAVAEDMTGQLFLKLLEAVHNEQQWNFSVVAWLYRIAHNLVVDHYRRQGRRHHVELAEWVESEEKAPDVLVERQLLLARVREAMNELTDEQAQVILLRYGDGLSNREIAARMGKSEGAVKALQHRALLALRRLLDEAEEVEDDRDYGQLYELGVVTERRLRPRTVPQS